MKVSMPLAHKTKNSLLNVVMIEDSQPIVERVRNMIVNMPGTNFSGSAGSVDAAFELIAEVKPDVAILDINLRNQDGRNGIYLLCQIRKIFPKLTIIMLTNLSDIRYRVLCMDYGADYFYDKSDDFDKIPDTLAEIVKSRREA